MSLLQQIKTTTARDFTTIEKADICCHPQFYEATEMQGWAHLESSYLSTQVGDRLEPLDDNLYCISWASDLQSEYGEVTIFSSLQQALELFFNHK